MRVLHLVSYPLYSGPLPQTLGLARAQQRLGHEVRVAYDRKRGAFNAYEEAAAPHLERSDLLSPIPFTLSTKSSPREYLRDLANLRRLVRSGSLDVVHVHLSHDHGLAALSGRGRSVRVRTFHADRSLVRRLGQKLLNRSAEGWITRCEEHRRRLLDGSGVAADRARVIPGSVDHERFAPADREARAGARQRFGLPVDAEIVGQVALIAGRGQEELIDAVAGLGDEQVHVLLAGRGEREAAVRARAAAAGLEARVHFVGYLEADDLALAYAALDVAFVAQPGNDASGRAALEAMAAGVPVLAVQTGALAELVDEARGYPIPKRTVADIQAGLRAWREDGAQAAKRAARARERVVTERSFSTEAVETIALYERVMADVR